MPAHKTPIPGKRKRGVRKHACHTRMTKLASGRGGTTRLPSRRVWADSFLHFCHVECVCVSGGEWSPPVGVVVPRRAPAYFFACLPVGTGLRVCVCLTDGQCFLLGCCRRRVDLVLHTTRDPRSGSLGFEMAFWVCLVKQSDDNNNNMAMTRYSSVDRPSTLPPAIVPRSGRGQTHVVCVSISLHTSHDDDDDGQSGVGQWCVHRSLPPLPFSVSRGAKQPRLATPPALLERFRTGNGSEQGDEDEDEELTNRNGGERSR